MPCSWVITLPHPAGSGAEMRQEHTRAQGRGRPLVTFVAKLTGLSGPLPLGLHLAIGALRRLQEHLSGNQGVEQDTKTAHGVRCLLQLQCQLSPKVAGPKNHFSSLGGQPSYHRCLVASHDPNIHFWIFLSLSLPLCLSLSLSPSLSLFCNEIRLVVLLEVTMHHRPANHVSCSRA